MISPAKGLSLSCSGGGEIRISLCRHYIWVLVRPSVTSREQGSNLSITIREAVAGFLEEQDETVGRDAFERIAAVVGAFSEFLASKGVTETSDLAVEHIQDFVLSGATAPKGAADTWFSVRAFVKWLSRRKHAPGLYDEFGMIQKDLRERLRTLSASK